jgi:hypothetical protein|tara:strand:+ start:282 stop:440 length:159 start_codon:yes stop_codon:yes gene_type:complete
MLPEEQDHAPDGEETFHVWRLLGVIGFICVVLAVASFLVDWAVVGPLEGRVL